MGILSRDRAVAGTLNFPVISGIIQLVFLWPQGHGMTSGVTAMLALRSLAAPPALTRARSTQVLCPQICSTAEEEPDAPVDTWYLHSLLSSGGSLAPLLLCAGLWTSPLFAVLLPTRGHLLLPELVLCSLLLQCQGEESVFVALARNEAKIFYYYFFFF